MHAVNSLHSASLRLMSSVCRNPSHVLPLLSRPEHWPTGERARMTVTSPTRWHNLLTQRTTLWCHTFRPLLHLAANLLHHMRKKRTRQHGDNVGTEQKTNYIFKPLCRRSGTLVVCLPARLWDVVASSLRCTVVSKAITIYKVSRAQRKWDSVCVQHLSAVVHIPAGLYYWLLQWLWLMHEWCSLYSYSRRF